VNTLLESADIVIIGAGIVGSSVAYYLSKLRCRNITVHVPLFHVPSSTMVRTRPCFQLTSSKAVCQLARWSVQLYSQLESDDRSCLLLGRRV
jgi:glycine/D-amino acid oxidase-like deaminating enzyme